MASIELDNITFAYGDGQIRSFLRTSVVAAPRAMSYL
jgi:hypothetical protein